MPDDNKLPNGETGTYGMNVDATIIITEGQRLIMEVLYDNPKINNKEIALKLGKGRAGVQTHIVDLYYRSGAKTRGELVAMASRMVIADQRGGNRQPIMKAYRAGRPYV